MSSFLQFSSPNPVTNTSSQLNAACAKGTVSLAAFVSATDEVLLVVAPAATAETPDKLALRLLRSDGTPVAVPPKLMLSTPITCAAAILMFPAAPMPASPASTVPTGASRSTSPAGMLGFVCMVRIPEPVASEPAKFNVTTPCWFTETVGGGTDSDDFEPLPASMLPSSDQMRILPPPSVNTFDLFTFTSPWV